MTSGLSRREALRGLAFGAAGSSINIPRANADVAASPAAASQPAGVCVLFPQAVEGPYYFDPKLVRSDIADNRPGAPLQLSLKVIDNGHCTPIAKARVDVWHADAGGIYSGYANQGDNRDTSAKGKTFLRGTQLTDADGRAVFRSIYPGWYPGRTPHIHVKIFHDDKSLVTGQIYFPETLSERIYRERQPYNARPVADTANANDFIFQSGEKEGGGTVFAVEEAADLISAQLLIAVDRSGDAVRNASGWRGFFSGFFGRR